MTVVIEMSKDDTGAELDVPFQVELVRNEVAVTFDLRLAGEMLTPIPLVEHFLREGIAIGIALGIETAAGITIPVPCTADSGSSLQDPHAQAQRAQPIKLVKARHAGADDDDIEIQCRRGRGARVGFLHCHGSIGLPCIAVYVSSKPFPLSVVQ